MKLSWGDKDGGPESHVRVWGLEIKRLFTVYLVNFAEGSREAYHSHAFNSLSWLLSGALKEKHFGGTCPQWHLPSFRPIHTYRRTFHRVLGLGPSSWLITFRGPWADSWREFRMKEFRFVRLTHGRREI